MGAPIHTHIPFSITQQLQTANEECIMREDTGNVSEDGGQFEEDGPNIPTGPSSTPPNGASCLDPGSHIDASEADAFDADFPGYQASTPSPPRAASKRPADRHPNVNSSKANYKKRRAKKRAQLAESAGTRLKAVSLLRRDEMSHTRASFDTATGRVASTAWMGHREQPGANPTLTYSLEELLASDMYNFRLERWDGR
jgi:hypothetical protein